MIINALIFENFTRKAFDYTSAALVHFQTSLTVTILLQLRFTHTQVELGNSVSNIGKDVS